VTDIAHEPVETAPEPRRRRLGWGTDNPLVRAVGRVRLPLGAKLLIGFGIVGALLAAGYVLGVVALGQSNSRGEQLRQLQRRAVYLQLVLTDATQLKSAIEFRINSPGSTTTFGSGLDQSITNSMNQLCIDSGLGGCMGPGTPGPFQLSSVDPALSRKIAGSYGTFYAIAGDTTAPIGQANQAFPVERILHQANGFATSLTADMARLARETRARTDALVAADHSSYSRSRGVLIGVGTASLLLAVALGLLLSWSVVAPLRRTEDRLAEIGAGDFTQWLDVPNRDEIGRLAARVNSTSDELQRVYRELELASEHKSQFLATMSHELRTPLNAIIGFSEVLHEQMFGELNERQLAYVNDVLAAGKHLLSLINDVLDLAKIEAGRMELELSEVAIPEVLRSAVSLHSERASREGLALSLTTEPEEITITADERRVRQVVFNLVSNAVKFTPADGRIDISAHVENGHVEVGISDTGPGIAAEERGMIFEEFEQTAAGRKAEGTGLGLPLSRKLVELHGGRLWVESEVGKGSTFRFTIPVQRPVHQEVS
jgi:signal transduction histidine kinase